MLRILRTVCFQFVAGGLLLVFLTSAVTASLSGDRALRELMELLPICFAFTLPALIIGVRVNQKVKKDTTLLENDGMSRVRIFVYVLLMNFALFVAILPPDLSYLLVFHLVLLALLSVLDFAFKKRSVWDYLFSCSFVASLGFLSAFLLSFFDSSYSLSDRLDLLTRVFPLLLLAVVAFLFRKRRGDK